MTRARIIRRILVKRTDFSYELPPELIAQTPRERGRSRMMVVTPRDGEPVIEHDTFANFPAQLEPGDVLVLNDTRVIPARLFAAPKGNMTRRIEVLLTRQLDAQTWETWCNPAKRIRTGDVLRFSAELAARVLEKRDAVVLRFEGDLAEIERIGVMPLPPYIHRDQPQESDRESYQTVYAAARGAIAAPTAGLHFTREILDEIAKKNEIARITLHVGIGTFKPVKADDVRDHVMDSERYEIGASAADTLNRAKRIVAVGTTTVRTLESAKRERFEPCRGETSIFITPGYRFRAVDRLLTNFHLPESTLIMLVAAFAGLNTIRRAYEEAIREKYFFYSYGDCMFIRNRLAG